MNELIMNMKINYEYFFLSNTNITIKYFKIIK